MFIGHYAPAFAIKAARPDVPLWHLFVAVQLVDFAWAGLVLAGIEKARITPRFLEASMLDLYHMPYTHALPSTILWAIGAALLYGLLVKNKTKGVAIAIGVAVLSHWVTDLLVHSKDLELWWGGPKLGFGLWASLPISQLLELGLFLGAVWLYFKSSQPKPSPKRWIGVAIVAFFVVIQLYSLVPPPKLPTIQIFAIQALFAFSLFSVLAWVLERGRELNQPSRL